MAENKMTREAFAALVARLETQAKNDPNGYRRKVGLLAALGYGFILLLLAGVIGIIALVVVFIVMSKRLNGAEIKILLVLGFFGLVILRSLYVKFEKPEGVALSHADAAQLFQSVNRLTDSLEAPRFHHILLVPEFNAAVVQHPRLGIFGWHTNYLLVGLPLMQGLSPSQFEAVLAHELGHLRGGHGKFGAWIYRVNRTYQQLFAQLDEEGGGAALLRAFFRWYAPYFAAYSFALRRADEYEADRCAAQITGPRNFADALCALPTRNQALKEHYWKPVKEALKTQPEPPKTTMTQMVSFLKEAALPAEDSEKALQQALAEETGTADTHPSLSDRLKAIRQEARVPEKPGETAAEKMLGPSLPRLADYLDRVWSENVSPQWRAGYEQAQKEQEQLAQLTAKAQTQPLTDEEAWQRANLTEAYQGEESALPFFRDLMTNPHPKISLGAKFAVGRILIQRDDLEGLALLEAVLQKAPDATLPALGLIHAYHKRIGDKSAAKEIYTQGMRHADKEAEAKAERDTLGDKKTRYLPHGLGEEKLAAVREVVAMRPDIGSAYLVRKEMKHFPEKPLYVIGVTLTDEWKRLKRDQDAAALQEFLLETFYQKGGLPGETFIVVMAGDAKWVQKSVENVPGALLYKAA